MFRPLARSHRRPHRRGTSFVLIVVVMISITASVGVAFALFAGQTLRITGAVKDGQGGGAQALPTVPEPTNTVNRFFGTLLYDADDNANADLTNALRGHSLARSMYGRDVSNPFNTVPWAGVGTFREDIPGIGDRSTTANYTQMLFGTTPFLLDPEYMGQRGFPGGARETLDATTAATRTYVGKHAGYSYPDLKDFFAAAVDPATGEVLVPSFHRNWLFGGLEPTNPNWSTVQGRLKTLRPRPAEHPLFPRVGPNADNTYTGDVQNWPGGYTLNGNQYVARNDSLWMHIGLPPVRFGNRKVQPLVAPLIVPLDGLFNASAHGNNYGPGQTHVSYSGHGSWEVNLRRALGTDGQAVIAARGVMTSPNGNVRAYSPNAPAALPDYSPIVWNGNQVGRPVYPIANSITGVPAFSVDPAADGFQINNVPLAGHPSVYNPNDWPASGTTRTFPVSDIKRLHLRYAFTPDWYGLSDVAPFAPTDLRGTAPFTFATGQGTLNGYRRDPAHANRALVTTHAFAIDRPKVSPSFVNHAVLALGTRADVPNKPGYVNKNPTAAAPLPFPAPQTPAIGTPTDFAAANRWVNALAFLGSVNLNRPLANYRGNLGLSLVADTTNTSQADGDRRQLAHDIFVRLVAALGAGATINPANGTYTVTAAAGTPEYNALRYLAQLAANAVDYIDDDDISTIFEWNPLTPKPQGGPFDPLDATNFTDAEIGNRVVFGVEKPRLVINEAYSEIVNNTTDPISEPETAPLVGNKPLPVTAKAHVRFWLELLNPAQQPALHVPPDDRSAGLAAYRIEIARASRLLGVVPAPAAAQDLATYLKDPANVTGRFPVGLAPDIGYTFAANAPRVMPNNGQFVPPPATLPANGMVLVGPQIPVNAPLSPKPDEFNPNGGPWANAVFTPGPVTDSPSANGMAYALTMPAVGQLPSQEFRRHVVLLRRLANPYALAGPTNPFITVDVMDYVPSFDSVYRASLQADPRSPRTAAAAGFDPRGERFAVGKVQPFAGLSQASRHVAGEGTYNQYTFPTSMVLNQARDNGVGQVKHTFGQHNFTGTGAPGNSTIAAGPTLADPTTGTAETLMLPFDWLVHMDRPLVNQIELFQVRDSAPHMVTQEFLRATPVAAPTALDYENGVARWRYVSDGLARALEYLSTNSRMVGAAHGGRVVGPISANALQDKRVHDGLFDPQPGNAFDAAFVDALWKKPAPAMGPPLPSWMDTRRQVTTRTLASGGTAETAVAPVQSIYDGLTGTGDRPFLPLGVPSASAGGFAYGVGANENATILRHDGNPAPYLYGPMPAPGALYTAVEPARKVFNNLTTVNHTYLVFLTIGYFELDTQNGPLDLGAGLTMPRLAHEACLVVPGDMRQKFVAVIDMTGMAIDPATNGQAATPFFTSLEQTARVGATAISVTTDALGRPLADGVPITPAVNSQLVIGYGSEQQIVTVASVDQTEIRLTAPLVRTAWAGSSVSNARPGYPGIQPDFSYNAAQYKPVIPYINRVR